MGAGAVFQWQLDLPTTAVLAGVGGGVVAILVLIAGRTFSPALSPNVRLLALGMAVYGAGFLLVAARQRLPPWISPVLGNGALVFSTVVIGVALRRLYRLPARTAALCGLALTAVCMAAHAWYVTHAHTVNLRLAIGTLCHIAVAAIVLAVPRSLPPRRRSLGLWLVVGAFGLFALLLLQRLAVFAFAGPMLSVVDAPALQSISYVSAVLLPLVAGFGFLQLYSQWTHDEIKRVADADYLTGCLNRRAFEEQSIERVEQARRRRRTLALVMVDVDDLKRFNAAHGRARGDRALNGLVARLRELLAEDDLLARVGGDEFAVLLDGADLSAAQAFGDRLRARLVEAQAGGDPLSVSIGLAAYVRGRDDLASMMQRADDAMYAQKRAHASDASLGALVDAP